MFRRHAKVTESSTVYRRMRHLVPLAGALWIGGTPATAFAQNEDAEIWIAGAVSGSVSGPLMASFDATLRFSDANTHEATRVFRPMIGYQASKDVSLWLGYTRVEQFPDGRPQNNENRLFEQLNLNLGHIGRVSISARTRLEQRYFENNSGSAWRFRQQLRIAVPLQGTKLSLVATTEPFVALETTVAGARHGIEQWRNSFGLATPLSRNVSVEVGYLNRYILHDNLPDSIDHIVPVTLSYHF